MDMFLCIFFERPYFCSIVGARVSEPHTELLYVGCVCLSVSVCLYVYVLL